MSVSVAAAAPVTITATAEALATPILNLGAVAFDGQPVFFSVDGTITQWSPWMLQKARVTLLLTEGAAVVSYLLIADLAEQETKVEAQLRLSPSRGSHSYVLAAFCSPRTNPFFLGSFALSTEDAKRPSPEVGFGSAGREETT